MAKNIFNDESKSGKASNGLTKALKNKAVDKAKSHLPQKAQDAIDSAQASSGAEASGSGGETMKFPKVSGFKNIIKDKAADAITAKAAPVTKMMGPKVDNARKKIGRMAVDGADLARKARTGVAIGATGARGFAGVYAIQKLAQGLHAAGNSFFNSQLGQFVELAFDAYKTVASGVKAGIHAVNSGMSAASHAGAVAGSAISSTAGNVAGHVGAFFAGAKSMVGSAMATTVGAVNGAVNFGLGALGAGASVATTSVVPTLALTGTLLTGVGFGATSIYNLFNVGGCLIQPAGATTGDAPTGSAVSGDMNKNAQIVADKLKADGATGAGIAGYLGNAQHESGIDPTAIQSHLAYSDSMAYDSGANGYAFGLNQWDGGRRVNLLNFAKSQNKGWTDLGMQLDFAMNHDGSDSQTLRKILSKNQSAADSAEDLRANWERGGAGTTAERQSKAEYWYKTLNLSSVQGNSSIIGGASDSATSNSDASAEAMANNCGAATASTDSKDGTGTVNATDGKAWAYNQLPADVAGLVHKVEDSGLQYGSGGGWANGGGQCVHFSSSYFFRIWRDNPKMPKAVVMVDLGKNSASTWAKAMGGSDSGTPKAGAIASVPANTPIQGDSFAGHTFVVEHVLANGDILIAEQNYGVLSGDSAGHPYTWNFRLISKSSYQNAHMTFFAPDGQPKWSN